MIFQNYLQISKVKKNESRSIKVGAEQHESTLGCSQKLSIKHGRVFGFFIYFYKLLKFPLLF